MKEKTILVELRRPGARQGLLTTTDDMNDVVVQIAERFSMDILSVSHLHDLHEGHSTTAIYRSNGLTVTAIAATLGRGDNLYSFEDRGKVSVVVHKFFHER